jgi:hypothetical protein
LSLKIQYFKKFFHPSIYKNTMVVNLRLRGLIVLICTTLLFSCKKEGSPTENGNVSNSNALTQLSSANAIRYSGSAIRMGNGTVRSFIAATPDGVPVELGIEMTRNAITNLPVSHHKVNFPLSLPAIAKTLTPFDHLGVDWNNHGHAPFSTSFRILIFIFI